MDKSSLKYKILLLFYFLFGLAVITTPMANLISPPKEVNQHISEVMKVTCKIVSEEGLTGTGILLDTGYIVTAAHLAGYDGEYCRNFTIEFFDDAGNSITGNANLAFISKTKDFAILSHDANIKSSLKFRRKELIVGEPIFTVGTPLGHALVTSTGYVSNSYGTRRVSSVYVAPGNSGGTLFSLVDGKPIGIVSACGLLEVYGRAEVMIPDGLLARRCYGRAIIAVPTNGVSFFVSYKDIFEELEAASLEAFLVDYSIDIDYAKYIAVISKTLLISLIAYSVWKIT